jgi:hypothetical protein
MVKRSLIIPTLVSILVWSSCTAAFRVCDTKNSYAFSAVTQYRVGEIAFDDETGLVSGTETTYNYTNQDFEGFTECHVTYEFSGIVESGSGTFILDAQRTNYSPACPGDLIDTKYPPHQRHVLQIAFEADGTSQVHSADSGELLTSGEWEAGRVTYNTPEVCTIF